MNKNWIGVAIVAALGVALAVVVFVLAAPDTGTDLADRPDRLERLTSSDLPPGTEDWHPDQVGPDGRPLADRGHRSNDSTPGGPDSTTVDGERLGTGHGNPVSVSIEEARNTPEHIALNKRSGAWRQTSRLLAAMDDPAAQDAATGVQEILSDMHRARLHPYDMDYEAFEQRETDLIEEIRQVAPNDPDLSETLQHVLDMQAAYRAGEFEDVQPPTQP